MFRKVSEIRCKYIRYFFALVMIMTMVGVSQLLEEKEVIFPEILALALGAWVAGKQPWKVNRMQLFLYMTLSSLVGVLIVRYIPLPVPFQVGIAFLFVAFTLMLSHTTMMPVISACILPILLGTEAWVYPISVCAMSGLIVIFQDWMEQVQMKKPSVYLPVPIHWKKDLAYWGKLLLVVFLLACFADGSGWTYMMAPPLLVAFAEISNVRSHARNRPQMAFLLLSAAALIGSSVRLLLGVYLGLPLWAVAGAAVLCMVALFESTKSIFVPAGAIALLPLLLQEGVLWWYPVQVMAGSFLLIGCAMLLFKDPRKNSRKREAGQAQG